MAISGRTPHANLPQWVGTDKPEMKDLNEAFVNIDTELAGIKENLEEKVSVAPPGWVYPTLLNGAEAAHPVRYRKELNTVFMEGWVKKAEQNKVLFVLEEGCRPDRLINTVVSVNAPSLQNHFTARLRIHPNGEVMFEAVESVEMFQHGGASVHAWFTAMQ